MSTPVLAAAEVAFTRWVRSLSQRILVPSPFCSALELESPRAGRGALRVGIPRGSVQPEVLHRAPFLRRPPFYPLGTSGVRKSSRIRYADDDPPSIILSRIVRVPVRRRSSLRMGIEPP